MVRVLVPLASGCEELEAVTIIDLLRRAGMRVVTVSLEDGPVEASRGVKLLADQPIDAVRDASFDLIVLPGGLPGADHLRDSPRVQALLKRVAEDGGTVAAICAAPKALAQAGLLDHKSATAYPGVLEELDVPGLKITGAVVERDGQVITSRGPGTAMDFALELIEALLGRNRREVVEKALVRG